jgi:hypothetical protein
MQKEYAPLEVQSLSVGQPKRVRMEIIVAKPHGIEDLENGPVIGLGNSARAIEIVKGKIVDAARKQMAEGFGQSIPFGSINHV